MTMPEYLKEIEHAASETLRLAWSEQKQLEELEAFIARLTAQNRRVSAPCSMADRQPRV
jgi:hypothetical protein